MEAVMKFFPIAILAPSLAFSSFTQAGEPAKPENAAGLIRETEDNAPWKYQIHQNNLDLDPDQIYRVTFSARSASGAVLSVSTKVCEPPWTGFGLNKKVPLSGEWETFEFDFEARGAVPGRTRLTFNFADSQPGDIWLKGISVTPVDGGAGDSKNLVENADFAEELTGWRVEGRKDGVFAVKVEQAAVSP